MDEMAALIIKDLWYQLKSKCGKLLHLPFKLSLLHFTIVYHLCT